VSRHVFFERARTRFHSKNEWSYDVHVDVPMGMLTMRDNEPTDRRPGFGLYIASQVSETSTSRDDAVDEADPNNTRPRAHFILHKLSAFPSAAPPHEHQASRALDQLRR
jgi:hypothetical protein